MYYLLQNGNTIEAIYSTDDEGKNPPRWKPLANGAPNDQDFVSFKTITQITDDVLDTIDESLENNYTNDERKSLIKSKGYNPDMINTPQIIAKKSAYIMGSWINRDFQKALDEKGKFGKLHVVDALESGVGEERESIALVKDEDGNKHIVQICGNDVYAPSKVMYEKASSVLDELFSYASSSVK